MDNRSLGKISIGLRLRKYVVELTVIDWNRVGELRDEIGAEDFTEVVDLFLEEVDEIVERLAHAPDPARYEEDMHFLKGSALNLGFQAFASLCANGEQKAAAGDCGAVDLGAVLDCYHTSKAEFIAQLKAGEAA